MCPVVGLCALKRRQEGVVNIDGVRSMLCTEIMAENLQQP